MLRWATELGRVDISHEVALLSQYQAFPREGYLKQLLNIFGYLKQCPKLTIQMDPDLPNIDYEAFNMEHDDLMEHNCAAE